MIQDDFEHLRFETLGEVLRVEINHRHSPTNTIDAELHHELATLFPRLRRDHVHRVVILTGSKGVFSIGADPAWLAELGEPGRIERTRFDARAMIWDLLDVPVPVICALNGDAVGLGASLALLSDVIFMAESATISDPHVRVALAAGDGGTAAWPLAVGPTRAKEYLLTGDPVAASEAERIGLVNHVVPDGEIEDRALAFAQRLAAGAPLAVQYTKQAINQLVKQSLLATFDVASSLQMVTLRSEDHREALSAINEKRPPTFRGR